jgi:membrane peptidoglycan carboxypeptidase
MRKRRVRYPRRPAKPIEDRTPGFKGHLKRFFLSFSPKHFREYWVSRDGAGRLLKLAGASFLFVFLIFLWYAKDLPTPGKINARVTAQTTKFYDSTHSHLLYSLYGNENRTVIQDNQVPDDVKNATIAIEDKNFYKHGAFSWIGILRAAFIDLTHHGVVQGGSTITQQYVKNALLDPTDRSFSRKIKELILSLEISQFYSKKDILDMYLNEIPYGNRSYGIESACKSFFPQDVTNKGTDKEICTHNMDLGQSALLAALLNAPTYYSPYGDHTDDLIARQHLVLDLMVDQGLTTRDKADAAKWTVAYLGDDHKISQSQNLYANLDPKVAHFVLYAQEFLENKYGSTTVTEGGLDVTTTLDYDKQMKANDAVRNNLNHIHSLGGSNAAMVVTDPKNGHIQAMLGSYDFNDKNFGAFNVATAQRQPGSSFKPIVYSTLMGTNRNQACAKDRTCPTYGTGTTFYDVPTNFGTDANPYQPQNYGGKTYGIVTLRQALAGSLNRPAVKALAMAGIPQSLQTAQSLGITTLNQPASNYGLSLVLGTGGVELVQMANAYESFANGGMHYESTPILVLKDQHNKVLEDNTKPLKPKQALDPQVASVMADVLSDTNAKKYVFFNDLVLKNICGNNQQKNCVHAGVKTGTTEHFNDAWTIGFTPDMVAGVWVGNNDNSPMSGAAADVAAPIWVSFMNSVVNGQPTAAFAKADGVKTVSLDKTTGRAVTAGTKDTTVDLFPGWYTPMTSADGKSAVVDKAEDPPKLATECTPPLAKETIYSSAIQPEITRAQNPYQYQQWLGALQHAGYSTSGGSVPTDSDSLHHCDDVKPQVSILGAGGGGPYNLNIQVTSGTFTANQLQVYFDDQIVSTQVINGSGTYQVTYSPTETGAHTFKAVVTDTGLYQATAQQPVDVTNTSGGSGSFSGLTPADGSTIPFNNVTFSWTPDPGANSYSLFIDNKLRATTGNTSRNISGLSSGNHSWYVSDDAGNTTGLMSFRIQ